MRSLVVLALLTLTGTAYADEPAPPNDTGRVVTKLVEMTNQFFDQHVDLLSHDMLRLRVDAEQRRANIALGGGDAKLVKLRIAGNVEVVDGTARVQSRVALGLGGKQLDVRLPTVDVAPASYRGERGVEVRLPLLRKSF